MQLSDAMLLGSTQVKLIPGVLVNKDFSAACGIGAAAIAVGASWEDASVDMLAKDSRTTGSEYIWGWLLHSEKFPCQCFSHRSSQSDIAKFVISHIFDMHVFSRSDWTLEQLIAWIKTVEPAENPEQLSTKTTEATAAEVEVFA